MMPTILHIDMDAFFASVEEKFDPRLRTRPLAVAGPGVRTVITTASYKAREWGVGTGMTVGEAKRRCPGLVLVKADHRKYTHASRQVLSVLESFTPDVEPYSVDEAFMKAEGILSHYASPGSLAMKIKDRIMREVGLICSIGIAPNKLLAKLATGLKKPDGLTVLEASDIPAILEKTSVKKLCGIGPRTVEELSSLGIETCGQLGRFPGELLVRHFGILGNVLSSMGRGEDSSFLSPASHGTDGVKSVGHSVTLGRNISDRPLMKQILLTLSEMVGRRARRYDCSGRRITLTVRYGDFTTFSRQKSLTSPVWTTDQIYRAACEVFDGLSLFQPVRLLGMSLGSLEFGTRQPSLIHEEQKLESLQETLDDINNKYGEFSVGYGDSKKDLRGHKIISPAWRQKGIRSTST
ncbi:MAG: DNA polymerase IV [bacterium]